MKLFFQISHQIKSFHLLCFCAKIEFIMNVITIKNLHKKFGKIEALNGLNLNVRAGEIHGFLGPNGAGKSTTIRIILGLLRKTSGETKLFDQDPWKSTTKLHEKLSYVPGEVNLWPNLTGGEIIDLMSNLKGEFRKSNVEKYNARRAELIQKFQLDVRKKFHTYSKGNRQKVALIAALVSDVPLYILDEPTSGLDPLMSKIFQDEIIALKKSGKTVLLSSHILSEVETLCDRVTIIKEGKTVAVYTLSELKREHENLDQLFLNQYEENK